MKKTKTLVASLIAIVMCFTMIIGTTFAWFTDSVTNTNNIITSGNVDVELWHCDFNGSLPFGFGYVEENGKQVDESTKLFLNVEGNDILWEPGASASETFRIKNVGSLAFKYEFRVKVLNKTITLDDKSLTDVVKLQAVELEYDQNNIPVGAGLYDENVNIANDYVIAGELLSGEYVDYYISLDWFSTENDNDYANLKMNVGIELVATQLMFENDGTGSDYDKDAQFPEITYPDTLDGEPNIAWYTANPNATEFTLTSAEDFAGLIILTNGLSDDNPNPLSIDGWDGQPVTFDKKTIKLESDVNLYQVDENEERVSISPIGDVKQNGAPFEGTFDGQNHTIKNLYQSGWAFGYEWGSYGSIGLFSEIHDATIKNVTIEGAECLVEGGDVSFIAGSATGNCIFENITIKDSTIATYNNGCGGIIGWSGAGSYTFKDITIEDDVVLGGLWGSFDSSIGGIVGQAEPGATYTFDKVNIACRLDVYNDCTASYDYYNYRMCGMLIGRCEETTTIDGQNYPDTSKYNIICNDVTVTYGNWADYHYCEPTPGLNGGRGMRVEAGYSYDGLPIDYDHSQCITNCNTLIPFDQIIGGAQLGVKGLKTYDGVTVNYNK